ncbi:RTX toxin protein [Actinobacillus lignieresii]|nr:RTX toxin protein [Actinobacillus lignieresii]
MDLNSYFYLLGGDTVGYDENSPGFYTPRNGGGSRNNSSDTGSNNEWGGNGHGNNRSNASDLNQHDNDDKNGNTNTPNNQGRNYDVYDPLALDLDGDGLETISMNGHKGALFDHEGIGIRTATGWLAADDGFLVLDRNQDGMINDISELFSNKNKLSDGSISSHGFVALSDLDVNKDKLIDQNDTLFSKLQVWRDLNRNGFSEPEELFSLEALNIKSLHTAYEERNDVLFGDNILTQLGKYEKTDGSFSQMGDINFSFNPFYSRFTEALNLTEHQKRAINLAGTSRVRDLREAATLSVELETLLQKYTVASDYKEQRSLLPVILDKWATTDLQYKPYEKELLKTVESTDNSAAVVRVTPTQLNNIRNGKNDPVVMQNFEKTKARISTLNSLYGLNINQLYYTTDEDIRYITDKVNNMYQTTVDLAYRSLLLQTRLKKYLYSINVKQVGGKWTNDYSRTKALFNATFYKSPENALYDLSEYLSFFEHHLKWKEGLLLLSYYIDYAKEQGFYENWVTSSNVTITHLKSAGILFAESINLKANQENNILLGNKNDNQLVGDLGDDLLIGGLGNDTLKGGYGSDTYIFSKGHGQDVIYEDSDTQHRERDIDILEFTDVNYAEVKFRREDNDLVIFGYHDNDSVKIKYFYSHEDYRFDQLVFSDRTLSRSELIKEGIHLYGTDSDDEINDYADWSSTLQGGTGNDTLKGGYGADTYIFSKGHGQDVIYEDSDTQHREHDIDILEFTDVNYAEVKFRREDNDLVIFGYHDNDSVKIKYFYSHEDYQFDRLVFLDRSLSRDGLREQGMVLFGTAGNDNIIDWSYNSVINADIGDDIIEAGKGDDTLIGGAGNDILKGSYGADTYIFSKGHGQDVIYEDSDSVNRTRDIDTIQFTDINHISELWFSREQNHLIIKSLLSEDSVTIQNWYSHQDYKVENIRLSDNRTLVIPEVERLVDAMASFSQQNGGNISLIPQESIRHYIDSIITNLS